LSRPLYASLDCSLARALSVVGDSWALLILRDAFMGERTFEGFQRHLGIPRTTLADRLRRLTDDGIVEAVDCGKRGTRFEYVLTPRGRDLHPALVALTQWGDRWVSGEGNEPFALSNRDTGAPLGRIEIRDADGIHVEPGCVAVSPGPGATAETIERYKDRPPH
jgi:DNA-binding HxlR family transcriptional regulator